MSSDPSDAQLLSLLSRCDPIRSWTSCRERRRCVICERVFEGAEVRVKTGQDSNVRLECPTRGCHSGPELWVHPGDPLVSDEAWKDWERVLRMVDGEPAADSENRETPSLPPDGRLRNRSAGSLRGSGHRLHDEN